MQLYVTTQVVIPAKAGIQVVNNFLKKVQSLDSRFRGNDNVVGHGQLQLNRTMLAGILWFFMGSFLSCWALDIPLEGVSASGAAAKIGYVDMERIFQLYPKTQDAKEDYAKQLKARREALAEKEKELEGLKTKISILESTVREMEATPPQVDESTGEVKIDESIADQVAKEPSPDSLQPQSLAGLKKELEDKRAEYNDARKRAATELSNFESRQSQIILGKIYQTLKDLAEEEQITIVVDKTSILYGSAEIDLTDKLQARVRGF